MFWIINFRFNKYEILSFFQILSFKCRSSHCATTHLNILFFQFLFCMLKHVCQYNLVCTCFDGFVSIQMDLIDIQTHTKWIRSYGCSYLVMMFVRIFLALVFTIDFLITFHLDSIHFLDYLFRKWYHAYAILLWTLHFQVFSASCSNSLGNDI